MAVFNGLPAQEAGEAGRSNKEGMKLSVFINFSIFLAEHLLLIAA